MLLNPFMKKLFLLFFFPSLALCADWYVTPSGGGSKNGKDWSNAWTSNTISWGSVGAGDTVWLAGGDYSKGFSSFASGSASKPVLIKRVTSSDPVTSAAGWQSSFDSAVRFTNWGGMGGSYSNLSLDGRVEDGIVITIKDGTSAITFSGGSGDNVTFKYVSFIGPGMGPYGNYAITFFSGKGQLISHCVFDGIIQQLTLNGSGTTIEYCRFLNCGPGTPSSHPDMIYSASGSNLIMRYNYFYNCVAEAVFFDGGGSTNIQFYGNVATTGPSCVFFQTKQGFSWGTFKIYNNVFADWQIGVYLRGTAKAGEQVVKNNIFWNCGWTVDSGTTKPTSDFNMFNSGKPSGEGSNSITSNTSPFINKNDPDKSALNWQILEGSAPQNKGTALANDGFLNIDMLGATRGADTAWDIGAFEYSGGGPAPTPTPPGPTPTPTATPTATPTPGAKFAAGDTVTPTATLNVRATPAGTVKGTHQPGDTGTIVSGPESAPLNGAPVNWYQITWGTAPTSGYSGDDDLVKTAAPSPTPSASPSPTATPNPTATPAQTYNKWIERQNQWTKDNPPTPD